MAQVKQLILILVLCTIPTIASEAHNKVVVIPLDDSEVLTFSPTIERTLMFGANGMAGAAEISSTGRLLAHNSSSTVTLYIKKPRDWNGTSTITLEMMTRALGTGSETLLIQFVDYNSGDTLLPEGLGGIVFNTSSIASFASVGQQRAFTASIPAQSALQDWWRVGISRSNTVGSNNSTIILETVAISYLADRDQ